MRPIAVVTPLFFALQDPNRLVAVAGTFCSPLGFENDSQSRCAAPSPSYTGFMNPHRPIRSPEAASERVHRRLCQRDLGFIGLALRQSAPEHGFSGRHRPVVPKCHNRGCSSRTTIPAQPNTHWENRVRWVQDSGSNPENRVVSAAEGDSMPHDHDSSPPDDLCVNHNRPQTPQEPDSTFHKLVVEPVGTVFGTKSSVQLFFTSS